VRGGRGRRLVAPGSVAAGLRPRARRARSDRARRWRAAGPRSTRSHHDRTSPGADGSPGVDPRPDRPDDVRPRAGERASPRRAPSRSRAGAHPRADRPRRAATRGGAPPGRPQAAWQSVGSPAAGGRGSGRARRTARVDRRRGRLLRAPQRRTQRGRRPRPIRSAARRDGESPRGGRQPRVRPRRGVLRRPLPERRPLRLRLAGVGYRLLDQHRELLGMAHTGWFRAPHVPRQRRHAQHERWLLRRFALCHRPFRRRLQRRSPSRRPAPANRDLGLHRRGDGLRFRTLSRGWRSPNAGTRHTCR
jgi:hypothetical protein